MLHPYWPRTAPITKMTTSRPYTWKAAGAAPASESDGSTAEKTFLEHFLEYLPPGRAPRPRSVPNSPSAAADPTFQGNRCTSARNGPRVEHGADDELSNVGAIDFASGGLVLGEHSLFGGVGGHKAARANDCVVGVGVVLKQQILCFCLVNLLLASVTLLATFLLQR